MKNLSRVRQLEAKRITFYTLWEAYPNQWHPGCYCLKVDYRRENRAGHIGTFFYVDGSGPTLTEVIEGLNL